MSEEDFAERKSEWDAVCRELSHQSYEEETLGQFYWDPIVTE